MILWDIIIAFSVALVLSILLLAPTRRRGPGPWAGFVFFFIILFLASWAGALWFRPLGAGVAEARWLPFVLVGLIVALLTAALIPPSRPKAPAVTADQSPEEVTRKQAGSTAFTIFYWILMVLLILAIILAYSAGTQ